MVYILKGTLRNVAQAENWTCNIQSQSETWYHAGETQSKKQEENT